MARATTSYIKDSRHKIAHYEPETCSKCNIQYIGESGNSMQERFRGHRSDIRKLDKDKPVSRHVRIMKHTPYRVRVLRAGISILNERLRTEEAFIKVFYTRQPRGLNLR